MLGDILIIVAQKGGSDSWSMPTPGSLFPYRECAQAGRASQLNGSGDDLLFSPLPCNAENYAALDWIHFSLNIGRLRLSIGDGFCGDALFHNNLKSRYRLTSPSPMREYLSRTRIAVLPP